MFAPEGYISVYSIFLELQWNSNFRDLLFESLKANIYEVRGIGEFYNFINDNSYLEIIEKIIFDFVDRSGCLICSPDGSLLQFQGGFYHGVEPITFFLRRDLSSKNFPSNSDFSSCLVFVEDWLFFQESLDKDPPLYKVMEELSGFWVTIIETFLYSMSEMVIP